MGKTTLAMKLLKSADPEHPAYFNWDLLLDKQSLIEGKLPPDESLIILDEIHKYKNWRNLVKGLYDKYHKKRKFLVTGSARLDYYSHGGDSLEGRSFLYRLHPLSLAEVDTSFKRSSTENLLKFGGFPEPFLKQEDSFWRRWQNEKLRRVIRDDLSSLEHVKDIEQITLLAQTLQNRVGSPLSIKSLREDLNVAHETAARWVSILENLYHCFRISPFGSPKIRAVKKEQKLYLWDWSFVKEEGFRFENLVASHLLKYCHYIQDTEGYNMELRFLRDAYKREIDFIVLKDEKPLFGVECKLGEKEISEHIPYFAKRTNIPQFYQVHLGAKDYEKIEFRTRLLPFEAFIRTIKVP